jgi:hypothetical protein
VPKAVPELIHGRKATNGHAFGTTYYLYFNLPPAPLSKRLYRSNHNPGNSIEMLPGLWFYGSRLSIISVLLRLIIQT